LMAHCARGEEYLVGQLAHTYKYEGGGAAVLGSIQPQPIENAPDGSLPLEKIKAAIKPDDPHFAISRLLALENTIGGQVLSPDYIQAAQTLARSHGLSVHLDGARAFNAAVAQGVSIKDICAGFDSVSICLSKGLGAPVGSVLLGSKDLIKQGVRLRKMLGGGMRQIGFLAEAGRYALRHNVARLAEDHANAAHLASGLTALGFTCKQATNMLFISIKPEVCAALQAHLTAQNLLVSIGPNTRFVTHLDVSRADIDSVIAAFKSYSGVACC
jgi:threonine aldolase